MGGNRLEELENRIKRVEDKLEKKVKDKGSFKGKTFFYMTLPLMIFVILAVSILYDIIVYFGLIKDWYLWNVYGKDNYEQFDIKVPER